MQKSAKQYCYDKVAKPGSALYFSLRGMSEAQRDVVVAVHAFYAEIAEIVFECQDHELALVKYQWWRTEVAKLTEGASDHPALLCLASFYLLPPASSSTKSVEEGELVVEAPLPPGRRKGLGVGGGKVLQEKLLAIIDGFQQASIPAPFTTFEEVVVHYMRTAGERELLLQALLETTLPTEKLFQAMLVIELVNYLQQLYRYARRNLIYFAADEMYQCGVQLAMFTGAKTTDAIKKLLQLQAEKVQRAYTEFLQDLSTEQRDDATHLLIRCEIAHKTLAAIQESDFAVLENFITLTPLRFWWIAWWNV